MNSGEVAPSGTREAVERVGELVAKLLAGALVPRGGKLREIGGADGADAGGRRRAGLREDET